jgi:hypothetical protein
MVRANKRRSVASIATLSGLVLVSLLSGVLHPSSAGAAALEVEGKTCTIVGTNGSDVLGGTSQDDVICGLGGNDIIDAGAGNDTVFGGFDNDSIAGGPGNDDIDGGAGTDQIAGDEGDDTIIGGFDNDAIVSGAGDDDIDGGPGTDVISAGEGNDTVTAGNDNDSVSGGPGDDVLNGDTGNDVLLAEDGDDTIDGGRDTDDCVGGNGTNTFANCEKTESSNETPPLNQQLTDIDNDGLPVGIETSVGTDPSRNDTDGDGLFDGFEYDFGGDTHDPLKQDTNGNGTSDSAEDADADGLSAIEEQRLGTSPTQRDTDGDSLDDNDEPNYGTNPTLFDTDNDGVDDGTEVRNSTDPTKAQDHTHVVSGPGGTTVEVVGQGDFGKKVHIAEVNESLYQSAAGQITTPVDITIPDYLKPKVTSASITITYDETQLAGGQEADLRLFVYDEANRTWVPASTQQTVNEVQNTVEATVPHFSVYAIFNISNWAAKMTAIGGLCRPLGSGPGTTVSVDVGLVLDSSGSMLSNDPGALRVQAAKSFVNALLPQDRAAVVDFDSSATLLQVLTTDVAALNAALDQIDSSGGTNIGAGVSTGLDAVSGGGAGRAKILIVLTDGEGLYDDTLTDQAAASGVTIYTIGLGTSVDAALLTDIAQSTGGEYFAVANAGDLPQVFRNIQDDSGDTGVDTDNDGLTDCEETNGLYDRAGNSFSSDPRLVDTDGDGLTDKAEAGEKRAVPVAGTPSTFDMFSDPRNADSDGDGLTDLEEKALGTDPRLSNSDGDDQPDQQDPEPSEALSPDAVQGDCSWTSCTIRFDHAMTKDFRDASQIVAILAGTGSGICGLLAVGSAGTLLPVCAAALLILAAEAGIFSVFANRYDDRNNCLGVKSYRINQSLLLPVEVDHGTYNCR